VLVRKLITGSILLALAVSGRADAAFPGANGKLVFGAHPASCLANCARYYRLFLADADGSHPVQIGVQSPMSQAASLSDSGPRFSPDGTLLAFTRSTLDTDGSILSSDLWLMRADGSDPHKIAGAAAYAWLPDGRISRLAGGTLTVAKIDGSQSKTLLQGFDGADLAWSPDGRLAAFARSSDIWVMRADGSEQRRVRSSPGFEGYPEWSPDGRVIAFTCQEPLYVNVCSILPDGSGFKSVTLSEDPEFSSTPIYTPDGTSLLFRRSTTGEEGAWGPYLMPASGGAARVMAMPQGWTTNEFEWQAVPRLSDPLPVAIPTPEPSPEPVLTPAESPAATPAAVTPSVRVATPSDEIVIPFRSGYRVPGVSRAKACRGKVTLTVRNGSRVLSRRSVKLDRRCRFGTTFRIARSRIGSARSLTVVVRFHGNRVLGATTNRIKVKIPEAT
jgi:hypothetical protein